MEIIDMRLEMSNKFVVLPFGAFSKLSIYSQANSLTVFLAQPKNPNHQGPVNLLISVSRNCPTDGYSQFSFENSLFFALAFEITLSERSNFHTDCQLAVVIGYLNW